MNGRKLIIAGLLISCLAGCGKQPWQKPVGTWDWMQSQKAALGGELSTTPVAGESSGEVQLTSGQVAGNSAWQEAMEEAARTNKWVLVEFVGSDWCRPCQKLEAEVLSTPEFKNWSQDLFVMYRADFPKQTSLPPDETQANAMLKMTYEPYVKGFPTVLVVDAQGQVLAKMGYQPGGPRAWIASLDAQLQRAASSMN